MYMHVLYPLDFPPSCVATSFVLCCLFPQSLAGICPQHDALWPSLSASEHLHCYGRLRGLKGGLHGAAWGAAWGRLVTLSTVWILDSMRREYRKVLCTMVRGTRLCTGGLLPCRRGLACGYLCPAHTAGPERGRHAPGHWGTPGGGRGGGGGPGHE